jgi:hypothetical protein
MPAASNAITSTTQQFLDIHDITSDIVILKSGAASAILTVNAMNFGLLAEEEQDAIIYAYAGLLNSLNFPIEIVIKSQTKDATNYLNLLKEQEDQATEQTKRQFISRYRGFVSDLIRERNVLDKKFYVVVSASALEMGLLPPSTVIPGTKSIDISTIERSVILEKARNIVQPRLDHLVSQFGRIGLFARQLTTQEIIQFFYTSYNPEAAEGQQITDTGSYTTAIVEAQIQRQYLLSNAPSGNVPAPVMTEEYEYQPTTEPVVTEPMTAPEATSEAFVQSAPEPTYQPPMTTDLQPDQATPATYSELEHQPQPVSTSSENGLIYSSQPLPEESLQQPAVVEETPNQLDSSLPPIPEIT